MNPDYPIGMTCPTPRPDNTQILLAHGGGGTLMHRLIERVFRPAFSNSLDLRHDGAVIPFGSGRLAFATDSYVVRPLFFPGGDIGTLAVNGTVNDLAMCGARPLVLSAGFILEEGLAMEALERVVASMHRAAATADVQIVTGDTKVVDRGKGDGLYVNTAGIGRVEHTLTIAPASVRVGDAVILSGDLGRHGISIMAVREALEFETTITSDSAPLAGPVLSLLEGAIEVHCLRDLTRGGLASALVEISEAAHVHIHVLENSIHVAEEVRGACEILGLDPIYVANEGRFIAFVAANQVESALALLQRHPVTAHACVIGRVQADSEGLVTMTGSLGTNRIIDMLSGEQLPRIC